MARPVRFPGMVEPACGAWCFLRAAQEQCVVERHHAAVLLHKAIAHDAAERVDDVEPGEAASLDHAEVGAPSPPGSDRRDGLCHMAAAREHAAEDEFHDGGGSGWRRRWSGTRSGGLSGCCCRAVSPCSSIMSLNERSLPKIIVIIVRVLWTELPFR